MAALFFYCSSRLPTDLHALNILWVQEKQPRFYCLSNSSVNEPNSRFSNGSPIERLAVYRAFFYVTLRFPNKQGLLTKQRLIFTSLSRERSVPSMLPPGAPYGDSCSVSTANILFIHSQSVKIFMKFDIRHPDVLQ
jgi:hypothetical protein